MAQKPIDSLTRSTNLKTNPMTALRATAQSVGVAAKHAWNKVAFLSKLEAMATANSVVIPLLLTANPIILSGAFSTALLIILNSWCHAQTMKMIDSELTQAQQGLNKTSQLYNQQEDLLKEASLETEKLKTQLTALKEQDELAAAALIEKITTLTESKDRQEVYLKELRDKISAYAAEVQKQTGIAKESMEMHAQFQAELNERTQALQTQTALVVQLTAALRLIAPKQGAS